MDLDIPNLAFNFLFSIIGFALFRYAQKQLNIRGVAIGVALMGYGYFMPSLPWTIGVGIVLCTVAYFWAR